MAEIFCGFPDIQKNSSQKEHVLALSRYIKLVFTACGLVFFHPQTSYGLILKTTKEISCRPLSLVELTKSVGRQSHVPSSRNPSNPKLDMRFWSLKKQ